TPSRSDGSSMPSWSSSATALRPPTLGRMPESSAHKTRGSVTKCSVSSAGTFMARIASCSTVSLRRSNDSAGACQALTGNEVLLVWHGMQLACSLLGNPKPGGGPACGWKPPVCVEVADETNAVVVGDCIMWQVTQRG